MTDVIAVSNDCDDGTDAMLDRLQAMGWVTHLRNPGPHPKGPQWSALALADRERRTIPADWIIGLGPGETPATGQLLEALPLGLVHHEVGVEIHP